MAASQAVEGEDIQVAIAVDIGKAGHVGFGDIQVIPQTGYGGRVVDRKRITGRATRVVKQKGFEFQDIVFKIPFDHLHFLGAVGKGGAKNIGGAVLIKIAEQHIAFKCWKIAGIFRLEAVAALSRRAVVDKGEEHVAGPVENDEIQDFIVVQVGRGKLRGVQSTGEREFQVLAVGRNRELYPGKHLGLCGQNARDEKEKAKRDNSDVHWYVVFLPEMIGRVNLR